MRRLAALALGAVFLAAPLAAQAATPAQADAAESPAATARTVTADLVPAAWRSCAKITRTKLNNYGWTEYKWVVTATNNCSRKIKYNVVRNGSSDYGYRTVSPGNTDRTYTGKLANHDKSKPDSVKMYYKGKKYTKTF